MQINEGSGINKTRVKGSPVGRRSGKKRKSLINIYQEKRYYIDLVWQMKEKKELIWSQVF